MTYCRLSALEREQICLGLGAEESLRSIAKRLKRAPSTISREARRLRHRWRQYHPIHCQIHAQKQASGRRQGKRKLVLNPNLFQIVYEKIKLRWSPQQIEKFLKASYDDKSMHISKESIYTYIYVFLRRNMREEFTRHLRRGRKRRRKKSSTSKESSKDAVLGEISLIDERPEEVVDRLVPGHWEGDLMIGGGREQSALGTLVERTTRFAILVPLKNKTADEVREQFARAVLKLPQHLRRTLTYDQGREMAGHKLFTEQTEMKVYFAHPRSPWERGTNENTNGLIRQYFPKGTNFRNVNPEEIQQVQDMLNGRPRMTLGWQTPAEKMAELLH